MKKHFRQTFCPTSRFRCIFKNSDSRKRKVFFRDRATACDRMHAIAWWQSGVESRTTRAHKKNRTQPNRTPPHMNMSPYPQRLCPRSPWQHPPWTRVTAPHLPMSPVQVLGGAAHALVPLVLGAKRAPIEKLRDGRGRDLRWPPFCQ